ncbi:hypothetical protein GOBAR_DD33094 [Gossypium barbadense]|nr:hypothetical protein GOBAR_DD33094 [Gossypium barbadense]
MILGESSCEDPEVKAPKKRAETWVQDETRSLIAFRREMDGLFNTSKSNKHLWEQISAKMRDKGFDRSPTMCTDKWRNLLKEFKKAKHQDRGSGSAKMSYYKEIEEILRERTKNAYKSPTPPPKVDSYMHFADKGFEDAGMSFGPVEVFLFKLIWVIHRIYWMQCLNLIDTISHHLLACFGALWGMIREECIYLETPILGAASYLHIFHKANTVTCCVNEAIFSDSVIGLVVSPTYQLLPPRISSPEIKRNEVPYYLFIFKFLHSGLPIKVCLYDESDHIPVHTEEKIFYVEDDYREYLLRRGYTGLREINGYRNVDNLDDLRTNAIYRGHSLNHRQPNTLKLTVEEPPTSVAGIA